MFDWQLLAALPHLHCKCIRSAASNLSKKFVLLFWVHLNFLKQKALKQQKLLRPVEVAWMTEGKSMECTRPIPSFLNPVQNLHF